MDYTHHQPSLISRNPVRAAYMASLESQISSLRDELATVYKTQGQNAQRLLSMNETLREKEEISRLDSEHLRKTKDEVAVLRKKVEQHAELMAEKDRTAQVGGRSETPVICGLHLSRFCMTRSIPYSLNWARSKSGIRHLPETTPNCSSGGSTLSRTRRIR